MTPSPSLPFRVYDADGALLGALAHPAQALELIDSLTDSQPLTQYGYTIRFVTGGRPRIVFTCGAPPLDSPYKPTPPSDTDTTPVIDYARCSPLIWSRCTRKDSPQ